METALDRRLADLITRRRLVGWPDLVRLREEAMRRGEARAGSPLAAALVRTGTLSAPQVDELLVAALGVSSESSGGRAFFQDPGASGVQSGFFRPAPAPAPDPERTVLDAAAPIALPTPPPGPALARPPSAGLPAAPAGPRPTAAGPPARPAPPRPAPSRPAPSGPAPSRPAPSAPGVADDDGARTIAAPPAFTAPGPAPSAPGVADDDGARTIAAPVDFGASPAPAAFGAGPAGFGSSPAAFGDGPGGFGSAPGGFGSAPGGPAGVHGGQTGEDPRTKAGPSEEEAAAAASQRLAAVFHGGRFARSKDPLGADGRIRATDQRIRRPVLLALGPAIAPDAAPAHPFFREARLLAAVGHPAVPRVHDAGVDGGRAFVAYDLPEGDRLPDALRSRQRPALPALLRAFLEVTAAVARAHEAGVLHGSLGPRRVVLGGHGRVLVDGWGWGRALAGAPAEIDEAAALPPPPEEDDPPERAPESGRDRVDARTDVFGLGLILQALLKGGGRPPGPLVAVARKATNPTPALRYHTVRALQEDVRRFLDGRSVSAEAESLLGAVTRLARKHPGAAGVAGVLGLLLLGVAGGTGLRIRNKQAEVAAAVGFIDLQKKEVQKEQAQALAQTEAAKQLRELTGRVPGIDRLREAARLAYRDQERVEGGLSGPMRARAIAVDKDIAKRIEDAIREAEGGLAVLAAAERSAAGKAEVEALGQVLVEALGAARLALATFWLREANRTRPDLALAEYQRLAGQPGVSVGLQAEGHLGAYLAARRLAGEEVSGSAALEKLAKLDHPLANLALVVPVVRASVETRSKDELTRRDGELLALLRPVLERPLAIELRSFLPSHRGNGDYVRFFLTAALLEPSDPGPYAEAIRIQNLESNLTPLWRYSSGDNLTVALRRSSRLGLEGTPCALDPTPALDAAAYLQHVQRKAASRRVIEPVVQDLEPLAAKRPEVRQALARARFLIARARLADGQDPGLDLDELQVPKASEIERHALRFWSALRAASVDRALAALQDLFPLVIPDANRRLTPEMYAALDDVGDALLDPAVSPQTIIDVASPVLARGGPPDFHLARAVAALRLGRDPGPDLDQASGVRPSLEFVRFVVYARALHRRQRGNPEAHFVAMRMWGQVNQWSQASEDSAVAAKAALIDRLRDLGHHDAADAFERVDPVDELFVLPAWLPPEAGVWRRP